MSLRMVRFCRQLLTVVVGVTWAVGVATAQTPEKPAQNDAKPPAESKADSKSDANAGSQPVTDKAREEQYNRLRDLAQAQERSDQEREERRKAKAARRAAERDEDRALEAEGTPAKNGPTSARPGEQATPSTANPAAPPIQNAPAGGATGQPGAPQPPPAAAQTRPVDDTLRTQWFNYQATPWPDALQQFAARYGKTVKLPDNANFGDPLSFVSARRHTAAEARDEMNRLLLPRGYQVVDTAAELRIVPLAEMGQFVATERTYDSAAAFQSSALTDTNFALVYLDPGDTSAQDMLAQAHVSITQHVQVTTDPDTGRTKLLGPARELRRFIAYKDNIARQRNATRTMPLTPEQIKAGVRPEMPAAQAAPGTTPPAVAGQPAPAQPVVSRPDNAGLPAGAVQNPSPELPQPGPAQPGAAPPVTGGETAPVRMTAPAGDAPGIRPQIPGEQRRPPADAVPAEAAPQGEGAAGTPTTLEQLEEMRNRARASTQHTGDEPGPTTRESRRGRDRLNRIRGLRNDPKPEDAAETQPGGRAADARPAVAGGANQPRPTTGEAGKTEWFAFNKMPWEDVILHFANRLKKPLMDIEAITIGGDLTYTNPRIMTKEDAIDELNMLLHEKGWRFVETEHHIYAVPLNEMPARVAMDHTFESIENFKAAHLRDMEYCTVYMQVKDRPAEDLINAFADAFPDYTRMSAVGKTNQIKMVMLARDIRKFLDLMDRIPIAITDPRQIKVFSIKTNPREMESLVREMVGGGASSRTASRFNRETGRVEQPQTTPESEIRIIADDRTNSLIVRATPERLKEISDLLVQLDVRQDVAKFDTTVIPIVHGNAVDIANSLNQIFQVEQAQTPAWQRTRTTPGTVRTTGQPPQPGQPPQTDWLGYSEDLQERARKMIRIAAEDRTNSIIVYANKDGLDRVKKMLETIDVALPSNFRSFKLEHARAEQIYETVNSIAQGMRGGSTRGVGSRGTTITLDAPKNALHVIAEREAMQNIERIIQQLDVESPEGLRHVIELQNVTPTRAAQAIQPMIESGASGGGRRFPGGPRGGGFTATNQIIPLDEARLLLVTLDDEELWDKVEDLVRTLDEKAVSNTPVMRMFTVAKGDPQQIANTLSMFYRNYRHPTLGNSPVVIAADGDKLYVQAIKPALDEIEALLPNLDVENASSFVILPLAHADAVQVGQQASTLFQSGGGRGMRGQSGTPTSIQADAATNSLIVQADKATLERVKDFAQQMDVKAGAQQAEQKFYVIKNAQPQEVASAVNSLFASTGGGSRRGSTGATQVRAVASGNQLIVDAPAAKQAEVAKFISQLDDPGGREVVIRIVQMPGADVAAIAQKLSAAFNDKFRKQGLVVRFDADPASESILVTCSKDAQEEADKLLADYREKYAGVVPTIEFKQLSHAVATDAATAMQQQLGQSIQQQFGRNSNFKVLPDPRTNKLIISGPQVAVKQALTWLEHYDVPPTEQADPRLVETRTIKLSGLDIASIADQLQKAWAAQPPRPDKLRAAFGFDPMSEHLIVTAPKDSMSRIEDLVKQFAAATEEISPVQRFIPIIKADANYIAQIITPIVQDKAARRGPLAASRIRINVDTRLNQLVINAPKFVLDMAEGLVKELDVEITREAPFHTIQLEKLDANAIVGILQRVLAEKMRTNRNLQISAEPLTNSLIVAANKEDFAEIEKWVSDIESKAAGISSQPQVFELLSANPWEVLNVLNTTFMPRGGQRFQPGKEIAFNIIGGQSIIAQAPQEKMTDIAALVKKLDEVGVKKVEIRTYELPGIGDQIDTLARQVQEAVNAGKQQREVRVSITTYAQADTWIVAALPNQFADVEAMMDKFKVMMGKDTIKSHFVDLKFTDAGAIAPLLSDMVTKAAQTGGRKVAQNFSVLPEPRTNRLIVRASDKMFGEISGMITQLDVEPPADNVATVALKFADPTETKNMIDQVFGYGKRRTGQSSFTQDVSVTVSNNMLVLKAPPKEMERIKALIEAVDAKGKDDLVTKTYQLKVLNAQTVAAQVQMYLAGLGTNVKRGQMKPAAFGEPTTNTLVVIAPKDSMDFIDMLVASLEAQEPPHAGSKAYALRNVRADQIAQNVQSMLRAKVVEKYGKSREQMIQTAVFAEQSSNRLFVFAPPEFQELAAELVKSLDTDVDTGQVVRIVTLKNADSSTLSQSMTSVIAGFGQNAQVKIVPDAGSNSVILTGLPKDVAKAEKLISDLEGTSEQSPELKIFPLIFANSLDVTDALKAMFPQGKTPLDTVVVTEDEWNNRLIVSTGRRKMRQVEAVVAQLDTDPKEESLGGTHTYFVDVYRGDAYDIASKVEDHFPEKGGPTIEDDWDGEYIIVRCKEHEFPEIERLIHEYDARSKVETKFVTIKPKGDINKLMPLLQQKYGGDMTLVMPDATQVGAESIVEELWKEGESPRKATMPKIERGGFRPINNDIQPCVLWVFPPDEPSGQDADDVSRAVDRMKASFKRPGPPPADMDPSQEAQEKADAATRPVAAPKPAAQEPKKDAATVPPAAPRKEAAKPSITDELSRLKVDVTLTKDGRLLIGGPKKNVQDLQDAIDLMTEDIGVGEVIKIFHFKYGDVNSAAQILDRMFNDRASAGMAQMNQLQQMRMQQLMGGRGGPGFMFPGQQGGDEQQGERGGRGGRGGAGAGAGGLSETLRNLTGRGQTDDSKGKTVGTGSIRLATDPGHSYLIVKCDESALPEIRQMLKELDIPPGQVDVKVFQLKNLVADEVVRNVKDVLGLAKAEQRRSTGGRNQQGGAGGDPFLQLFQQQLFAMNTPTPGAESGGAAKIESVEIVANSVTNSVMVSAPPDVMRIIEDVINKLEGLEGRNVVGIHRHELKKAKVDDVVPLLEEVFGAVGGSGGGGAAAFMRGGGGGGAGRTSSPAAMGPINISADPRTNTVIYTCENKDAEIVEAQLALLDIEQPMSEAETYVCQYGEAAAIADVVDSIYGSGAASGGGGGAVRGRRGAPTAGEGVATAVRITSEPVTNTIIVWGPREKRDLIFAKIEELDKLNQRAYREIPLANADAEDLADKLMSMFGGRAASGGGGAIPGGRRPGGAAGRSAAGAAGDGRVVIMGDANAKKLLVRAPESVYKEILNAVQLLDVADPGLQVQRFALKHAKAENVVNDLKQAMQDYMTTLIATKGSASKMPFDAFTVLPDTRTNGILVVGSEQTFAFVNTVLGVYDVETPSDMKKQFKIYAMGAADAAVVADAINSMATASAGGAARGGTSPMGGAGRGRGAMPSFGGAGGGGVRSELDVIASAESATNSVLVYGTPDSIAIVEKTVIDEFDRMATELNEPVFIPIEKAQPSQVATFIRQFFGDSDVAAAGTRGGRAGAAAAGASRAPTIIPNDNTKMLIVRGTKNQIERVRELAERFDDPAIVSGGNIKVIPIPLGQDAVSLAREVERVINESQRNLGQTEMVTVEANEFTNSLIVAGPPTMFGMVDAVVTQLASVRTPNLVTRVLNLKNVSAEDAQSMIDQLAGKRNNRSSTTGGGSGTTPRRSGGSTGGSTPGGGFNQPSRGGGGGTPSFTPPTRGSQQRPTGGGGRGTGGGGTGGGGAPSRPRGSGGTPIRPQGGGGGGGGGAAPEFDFSLISPCALWMPPYVGEDDELDVEPAIWEQPFVASRKLAKDAAWSLLDSLIEPQQKDAPATQKSAKPAERPARAGRAATRPAVTKPGAQDAAKARPVRADEKAAPRRETAPPAALPPGVDQAEPVEGGEDDEATTQNVTISGSLRSEVYSMPLDSQRLIITGDEQDVAFIEQLLGMMEATGPSAKIEVIPLKHTKAATLAQAVQQIVEAWINQRPSRPGPSDRINIVPEARSNSLIVSATEVNLELIRDIISKLDLETITGAEPRMVLLQNVRASEAVSIITPMIKSLSQKRETPDAQSPTVQAIDRSNSVLIVGTKPDIEEIQHLLETIDVTIPDEEGPGTFTTGNMVIVNLKNAVSDDVAKLLTDMIKTETDAAAAEGGETAKRGPAAVRKLKLRLAGGRELPELNLEKPIRVISEKGTNSVIIYSSEKNNAALTEIVGLFDTLPPTSDVDVKSFVLEHADATETAEALQKLFDEGKKALFRPADAAGKDFEKGVLPPVPAGAAARGLPYDVVVSHDARTNALFVIGRKDAVALAGALITQIDQPGSQPDATPHVITLKNLQASTAAEKLTQLMDKRTSTLGKFQKNPEREGAIIIPEDRSNQLVVIANSDVFDMVRNLAEKLDTSPSYTIVSMEYRHLQYADANKLQGTLQQLFDRKSEAVDKTGKSETKNAIYIIADARSNSLMLTGTRDYIVQAGELIDRLDKSFDPTVEFKIRPVLLNSAVNIAGLLQDLVDKTIKTTTGGGGGSSGGAASTPIHIAADGPSNTLVLGASHEDMVMIEKWVDVLDRPTELGRMIGIIPLKNLKAEDLSKSVQDVFTPKSGQGGADVQDTTITFDKLTNSIVAVAPPGKLKEIEDTIRRMDGVIPNSVASLKVFKLQQADAETAQNLLNNILEGRGGTVNATGGSTGGGSSGGASSDKLRQTMLIFEKINPGVPVESLRAMRDAVTITADVRTNSLYVTASPESMGLMESLVAAIDVPPDAATVRTFPLRNASAEEMAKMLTDLFQQRGTTGTSGSTGASGANDQQRELVLEGGTAGGRQQVTFTTDVRTNSVIAAGTPGYLDRVEQLILDLDSKPIRDRKTLVYVPRNNEAASIADSIKAFSDAEKARYQELGQDISTARKLEREVTAIANEDSNTVVLSYDPNFESDVMHIVRDLDQPPPQVMIQVLIIEVTLDNSMELGVEFAGQDLQFAKAGAGDTTTFDYVGGTDVGAVGAGLGGFTFTVTGADFNFLIRTLQNEGNIKVLSRPMIMAMDNQEATFDVSNDVPYVSSTATTTGGVVQTNVARENVGVTLTVTPQINPDGYVRMKINQEVSDFAGSTVDIGNGITAPVFLKRIADTTVTVMDNETVVLGGLITTKSDSRDQKVPILGDIPVLGAAFRHTTDTSTRTELLMVLTPRVVRTIEDFREISTHERDRSAKAGLIDEDILTNPLMNKLRVKPDELFKHRDQELLGPFQGEEDSEQPAEAPSDQYGPVRPASQEKSQGNEKSDAKSSPPKRDPNSYDLPLVKKVK